MTVQGPRSRELLGAPDERRPVERRLPVPDRAARSTSHYARVLAMRVTYVGELGWELHVPGRAGAHRLRRAHGGRRRPRLPQRRPRRDGQPAPREGLPRLRPGHRQHRHAARRRARLRRRVGQARRVHRARGAAGAPAAPGRRRGASSRSSLEDPEPLLYGGEPVLPRRPWLGLRPGGAYGHTLGGGGRPRR